MSEPNSAYLFLLGIGMLSSVSVVKRACAYRRRRKAGKQNIVVRAVRVEPAAPKAKAATAGQTILEFALLLPIVLALLLGGLDLGWLLVQDENFAHVVGSAADCIDVTGCDPVALAQTNARGLGLNPALLQVVVNGKVLTASYQTVSLTGFLKAPTLSASVTAP